MLYALYFLVFSGALSEAATNQSSKRMPSTPKAVHKDKIIETIRSGEKLSSSQLKDLKFSYDHQNPMPRDQVRKLETPLRRARASNPYDKTEVRKNYPKQNEFQEGKYTNAEFVAREMLKKRRASRQKYEKEIQGLDEKERLTGKRDRVSSTLRASHRLERAKQGDPNENMTFMRKGKIIADPMNRSKGEYIESTRKRARQNAESYRRRKKEKMVESGKQKRPLFDLNKPPPEE